MLCVIAPSLPEPVFEFDGVRVCEPNRLLSSITDDGPQVMDVVRVAESVTSVFGVEPEIRAASTATAQPARRATASTVPVRRETASSRPVRKVRAPARPKRKDAKASLFKPLLMVAGLVAALALWPTIMPMITDAFSAVSERAIDDLASSADSPSPTTAAVVAAPPAVGLEASCPIPGNGWVVSLGWPGDLPPAASAYSIRSQTDDGPITRQDIGGWTDPSDPPAEILVPDGTSLRVITDFLDDDGQILASTPQLFEAAAAC